MTFVNTLDRRARLTLRKAISRPDAASDTAAFSFTVRLFGMSPGEAVNSNGGRFTADDDGVAERTVFLHDGESLELEDVPVGLHYEIVEAGSKYLATYQINAVPAEGESSLLDSGEGLGQSHELSSRAARALAAGNAAEALKQQTA